ncbi:basement membrane-specific heparan sulfate proteoglycan core protein isoform X5 [Leptidea sinapis]|uniref:basement membrane-specific heparan sulfate proteoglycan core protein isoform X5 n=1 Tax=Leptidea sinapis TaxID=189913 RepID=UPI0021C26E4D|nr:basement membrane-specific heparan sulfate proteoglycan core protein isoform X5 [Leptidea sinapis]
MGARPLTAAFLLLITLFFTKVTAEDLYLENNDEAPNEFLEVDSEDIGIGGRLRRLARDIFDSSNIRSNDLEDDDVDFGTDDEDASISQTNDDFDAGSGQPDRNEIREETTETLRVSFVVNEPYKKEYSDRDSEAFQTFSRNLSNAVNNVFRDVPGTYKASLVRIQTRPTDEFSCNVTLEIVSNGQEDVNKVADILRDHIKKNKRLGYVLINDVTEFSATIVDSDPGLVDEDQRTNSTDDNVANEIDNNCELRCNDNSCYLKIQRCDNNYDCSGGEDELECGFGINIDEPIDPGTSSSTETQTISIQSHSSTPEPGDGVPYTTTLVPTNFETSTLEDVTFDPEPDCSEGWFQCDETRCVSNEVRCDMVQDCNDGADEAGCEPKSCGADDFRCNNGECISQSRKCNGVDDCQTGEDEYDCNCSPDEFRCESNGICIPSRQRCDGEANCNDGSDELDCASGYYRCRGGKLIHESERCNRRYDCDHGDYSDEQNCPCGDGDFKCDNGYCIPRSKHCDRTHDCQDGSDERHCTYGSVCMAFEYMCSSGQCVSAESRCNQTVECGDGSDETNCPCKRDQFQCRDGTCINIAHRCNGEKDCRHGEDEFNCEVQRCGEGQIACNIGSSLACANRCDQITQCDGGEDEEDCDDCHFCDGKCLEDEKICDINIDCSDASDEANCNYCDGENDFRCKNGECINIALHCNGVQECSDGSDETECNNTAISAPTGCTENQFRCQSGDCINVDFKCDGNRDCNDNSDEENCSCSSDQWKCFSGQCISSYQHCDNVFNCDDGSDEYDCPAPYSPPPQPTTQLPTFTTTLRTVSLECTNYEWKCYSGQCIYSSQRCDSEVNCDDGSDELDCPPLPYTPGPTQEPILTTTLRPVLSETCPRNEWRCENGPCIPLNLRCNGRRDCPYDNSDELDCSLGRSAALELEVRPKEQTVRYGGDVVFTCRDKGLLRAAVRWVREGGRRIKAGSTDRKGRLEMINVTSVDEGVYICQAPLYLGQPGAELKVYLKVEKPVYIPSYESCAAHEATCGNGQCIPKTALCNGINECSDGSDEDACQINGKCEPNQFECNNHKCILKTWRCDSFDDCGDNSDEMSCGSREPGQSCSSTEFSCANNNQCIPKSFHCDGHEDCLDISDEIGCAPVSIVRPPEPTNVRLNPGDTLTLVCEAVGVPTPLVTWRLNWGHVPQKCTSTSSNGIGTLTCPDMQPGNSGAYSCEAINNRGTVFAYPDSIVFVNRTEALCPPGYFNSEASSQSECIRCFCFGESTTCKTADLFIYNMPTPLGQGGTRLVGIIQSPNGDITVDKQSINNQYYEDPQWNGVTVMKLEILNAPSFRSDVHPYITLPESYNGNQLTSYGGHIKYKLSPHNPRRYGYDNNPADIILVGKYQTLFHVYRGEYSRDTYIEARLTPENWMKKRTDNRGLAPATREDIMMALDDVEMILLRADLNNAGVNITDFAMESAHLINSGLGVANLVEECTCPPGYEGLSCQKCASGYIREKTGPWLGSCVRRRACPPGTYGDPYTGGDCRPCPCPLTNRENQFARTCSVGANGDVICDCMPGYEGSDCSRCAPNYVGNPLIIGDSCKPKQSDNCNPLGTAFVRQPDECVCKDNVEGRYCDQCRAGNFFLSSDFRYGCASCFCSGVPTLQDCTSSKLRRKTTRVRFNVPQIVNQVTLYKSAPLGPAGAVRYNAPIETDVQPEFYNGEISLSNFDRARPSIYYWSLPVSFSGDKVTSYGGYLNYELRHISTPSSQGSKNNAADVQIISDNSLTFNYYGNFMPGRDGYLNATVQFLEKGWQRPDGKEIPREQFLLALADVKTILVKATYTTNTEIASLISASIETAESGGDGPLAQHVEQCVCPPEYVGTSCEDCAPGYTRNSAGLYLERCGPCNCNGKSSDCHPETGVCYNCADNTDGPNCEVCRDGYERDYSNNCVYSGGRTELPDTGNQLSCNCDPRGEALPCDENGYCNCKQNVEGESCDRCRVGTFGLDASNPEGCLECFCSGVTKNCQQANHFKRIQIPAPIFGESYNGYALMDINGEQSINDHFVPSPNESLLMYVFDMSPVRDLYWSLPVFPGNRVLSYGGTLSLTQKFQTGGYSEQSTPGVDVVLVGDNSIYWRNPSIIRSNEALSYQVPLREDDWYILNSVQPVSRSDFMRVLKKLRRVLVRATLTPNVTSTAIADVSMDTATESYDSLMPTAKGIEVCTCPEGYTGTSCENCNQGFYEDQNGFCSRCNCNGHDCQLNSYNEVICNCRAPYTGPDCSTVGLIMELHPTIYPKRNTGNHVDVTFTCKYRAPEPLTIRFFHDGQEIEPANFYNESKLHKDGWRSEQSWNTTWDRIKQEDVYECQTITKKGFILGVLTTTLPEKGGEPSERPNRPQPPQSTVVVQIMSPTIKIQEVGGTVTFFCQAHSRKVQRKLEVSWSKADGYLPQERTYVNQDTGELTIQNLQISDSGKYICQTSDGISTDQATATLKVPANAMTLPTVSIYPSIKDYYEGDRIELTCSTSGNPAPSITWQRASNRPLPRTLISYDASLVIESARVEDSGEYRCIASNTAGSADQIAVIRVQSRPSRPSQEELKVPTSSPTLNEGQSTQIVCTGTINIPAGTINWVRQDETPLLSNVQSRNGVLYISNARVENSGIYVCQTSYRGVEPKLIDLTVISLSTPSPEERSNISVSVNELKIPTGGRGTIDCIPHGYPLPNIRWTKYQEPFGSYTFQRDNTLIINNAQDSDRGYYLCEGIVDGTPIVNIYVNVEIERREAPRVEIYPPGENFVSLGNQFQIHCRVLGGIPTPTVTWQKDRGGQLASHVEILQRNVLSFQTVDVNDEGEYTCTATNEAGTNSASMVVKVRSVPVISITPNNNIKAIQGDRVVVTCTAEGYPEPMVSIKTTSERLLVPPTSRVAVLEIPNVGERDEDTYVCTAKSMFDTVEDQFAIEVDRGDGGIGEDDGSGEDQFDVDFPNNGYENQPRNMVVPEGKQTRINCEAGDNFQVEWSRADRRPLQYNARQEGTELVVENTSKADSGRYECTLINSRTGEVQHSVHTSLRVLAPPRIELRPRSQIVYPGESPTVECVVEGDDVRVSWAPVNRLPSRRVQFDGSVLTFRQIEVEDAGEYECFAENEVGRVRSIAEVIVNNRTPSESHDNEQFAHVGSTVHLSCNVTQPNLRIRWTKDGRALPRSVTQKNDGSLFIRLAQKSDRGRYVCIISDGFGGQTSNYINLHIEGTRDEVPPLVSIVSPQRAFRVGETVEVICRAYSKNVTVSWERLSTNQFVDSRVYGEDAILIIQNVQLSDAGVYRCTGTDRLGRRKETDFDLNVVPVSNTKSYPINAAETMYSAKLGDPIDIPCSHNLNEPASIEWRREYTKLPPSAKPYGRNLHIDSASEADAGTYICRVRNNYETAELRATLRVFGIIPKFNGDGWIELPKLKDVYTQFEIEISFKPTDNDGIILYNGQYDDGSGHYLLLELIDGVPYFTLKFDDTEEDPLRIRGDRPLQINTWHTIRLRRSGTKVTMDVDNIGSFEGQVKDKYQILELNQPLYIGNAPQYRPDASGFAGCVSMLIVGKEEKNLIVDSLNRHNVYDCDSCSPNLCLNRGVCQEARNERGYVCLCAAGFAGPDCNRTGEACRPGLCGPGKCSDTASGYSCACPVTFTGKNCDVRQNIEYPAFTGSAFLAIKSPVTARYLKMSMTIKPRPPVTDGIIMYCAQHSGFRGFTALTVRNGRLEFTFDLGDGSDPVVLTSNNTLLPNEWTSVQISRIADYVSLEVNMKYKYNAKLSSPKDLHFDTPLYVGGVEDPTIVNKKLGVEAGFSGCIKDVTLLNDHLDLINSSILSANVQNCVNYDRGDIPEFESVCGQCLNGGYCQRPDSTYCTCKTGFSGTYCEKRSPPLLQQRYGNPCADSPCQNRGECKVNAPTYSRMNYTCDCPLGYAGATCQIPLTLQTSVGFSGNGYLELPRRFLRYDQLDEQPAMFALIFQTTQDGVLLYQKEHQSRRGGDFILLSIKNGIVMLEWDFGRGIRSLTIDEYVTDGIFHRVIARLYGNNYVELDMDGTKVQEQPDGLTSVMNADSNIYIGGIPEPWKSELQYQGLNGCVQHVEFNDMSRAVDLGQQAVAGRNAQLCRK